MHVHTHYLYLSLSSSPTLSPRLPPFSSPYFTSQLSTNEQCSVCANFVYSAKQRHREVAHEIAATKSMGEPNEPLNDKYNKKYNLDPTHICAYMFKKFGFRMQLGCLRWVQKNFKDISKHFVKVRRRKKRGVERRRLLPVLYVVFVCVRACVWRCVHFGGRKKENLLTQVTMVPSFSQGAAEFCHTGGDPEHG